VPAAQARAESAYVLLRGRAGGNLARCYARLFVADGICCCDAVIGCWDIVLLVQATDRSGVERIAGEHLHSADVESFEIHYTSRPPLPHPLEALIRAHERAQLLERAAAPDGNPRSARLPSAYAQLDVVPECLPSVYVRLCFDDDVVSCHAADGFGTALALVQARTDELLERAMSRIRSQPGVRRSRTLRIIHVPEGA
jgi:hypothetical protein